MNSSIIPSIPPLFQYILVVWAIVWKGLALWKSAKKIKIVWFIFALVLNTVGIFEIGYIFVFSKVKNTKQFNKLHDSLLVIAIISGLLSILTTFFLIPLVSAIVFFAISLLQEMVDKKDWKWLILGIILSPIFSVIYYFSKVRGRTFKTL